MTTPGRTPRPVRVRTVQFPPDAPPNVRARPGPPLRPGGVPRPRPAGGRPDHPGRPPDLSGPRRGVHSRRGVGGPPCGTVRDRQARTDGVTRAMARPDGSDTIAGAGLRCRECRALDVRWDG